MINVLFCGDYAPVGSHQDKIRKGKNVLSDVKDIVSKNDVSFVNLEVPLTDSTDAIIKNGPNLKCSSECIKPLRDIGISVVGLANNHVMDFGASGLKDTQEVCLKANIDTVGAGEDLKSARKIFYKKVKNKIIAIIAVAEYEFSIASDSQPGVAPLDHVSIFYQIEEAKKNADIILLTIHAGNEHFPLPRPRLRDTCKFFIDLGVDAVINHHTHIPSAYEFYKGKPIIYGLGNFLFESEQNHEGWNEGYMASLSFDLESGNFSKLDLIPYVQSIDSISLKLMDGKDKEIFEKKISSLNMILSNENKYKKSWDEFCEINSSGYMLNTFFPFSFRGIGLLNRMLKLSKIILNKKTIPVKVNMIECESHREAILNILKRKLNTDSAVKGDQNG